MWSRTASCRCVSWAALTAKSRPVRGHPQARQHNLLAHWEIRSGCADLTTRQSVAGASFLGRLRTMRGTIVRQMCGGYSSPPCGSFLAPTAMPRAAVLTFVLAAFVAVLLVPQTPANAADNRRWPDERVAEEFHFHADFDLDRCGPLVTELTGLRKDLEQTLRLPPSREPIHLFLFAEKETYQEYLRIHFPKAPDRRALFIKARGPGMVFAHCGTDFEIDVRHECTHAVLHAALPDLPLWLDEGLAEYFEVAAENRRDGNSHATAVKGLAKLGELPRLEELESLTEINQLGRREYREAWAWTHFCLEGPAAAKQELQNFLNDRAAAAPTESLGRRLQRKIPRMEEVAREHFANLR